MSSMPVFFIGHGSPMNAIEDTRFRRGWARAVAGLPRPRAVLCVSAHWETPDVAVTAAAAPATIHDFHGFPERLFAVRYPAPGAPELARRIAALVAGARVRLDERRGLDHGAWAVLLAMFPDADVPVLQLSLESTRSAALHYALGRELRPLRDEGVLIVGSGDIVHNLGLMDWQRSDGYGWAATFEAAVLERIRAGDHQSLLDVHRLAPDAPLALPTPEHYLPLLYVLALQREEDQVDVFNQALVYGSISMTCLRLAASPRDTSD